MVLSTIISNYERLPPTPEMNDYSLLASCISVYFIMASQTKFSAIA